MWSGLGFNLGYTADMTALGQYLDELKSYGVTDIRVSLRDYTNTSQVDNSKSAVAEVVERGMNAIWGISSNPTTITSDSYTAFHDAVLAAAAWAQANGVYEFQLGNEEELHVDGTTMTVAQIRTNLKNLATEVQAIFTRGNVSYSFSGASASGWITIGRGDIDKLGMNLYLNSNSYPTALSSLLAEFTNNHCYITEFSLNSTSLATFSSDEDKQAIRLGQYLNEIKDLGYTRALFFSYVDSDYGCKPTQNGDFKLLWNNLTTDNGRRWFI